MDSHVPTKRKEKVDNEAFTRVQRKERREKKKQPSQPGEGQASQASGEVAASQNQVVDDVGSTSGVMKDEQQTVPAMNEYRVNEADVKLPCGENKKEDHGVENREKGGGSMDSTSSRPLFEAVLSSFKTRRIPLGEKQNSNRFAALSREDDANAVLFARSLKRPLRNLRSTYGNLERKVVNLKVELDAVQSMCDSDLFNETIREDLARLLLVYQQARMDEEAAIRQRAKIRWLNEGDVSD
ncbi:hypothetical protein L6452_02077 [Arctium lappa]|uniref:Uncharacterized protein n=1 Tax=Arctium lappa TaxID=4217 RepID=A0ACB9FIK1_ARCLA|nr:hypothetical protein L6452_02077 [Arctium lappa]